jgi:MIP family channel proteins
VTQASKRGSRQPGPGWPRRLGAEALGTFALVFVAVGGDAMGSISGEVGTAARAVAPALTVTAMIYAIGDVSGAHLNPVVSLAFTLKRLFPITSLGPYWAAQAAGGVLAALAVGTLFGSAISAGVTHPSVGDGIAVSLEAILTLLLVAVILGTADRHRVVGPEAAIAVGATIAACGLIALPITGASMNPVRSLAPALVSGDLAGSWIYVVGPVVGGVVAVLLIQFLHGPTETDDGAVSAAQGE